MTSQSHDVVMRELLPQRFLVMLGRKAYAKGGDPA